MALRRLAFIQLRQFHRTSRYHLSEDGFDFRTIVKSNSKQSGFNDLEKKNVTSKASKSVTRKTNDKQDGDKIAKNAKTHSESKLKHIGVDDLEATKVTKKSTRSVTKRKSVKPDGSGVTQDSITESAQNGNDDLEKGKVSKTPTKSRTKKKIDKNDNVNTVEDYKAPIESMSNVSIGTVDSNKSSKPQIDLNGNQYKVQIPGWLDIVLECPFNPTDKLDLEKFEHFKNFVEELEIKNLPTVTTIIKKTEPDAQAMVLQKWAKRKTKELGGERQFQEYRQKLLTRGSTLHSCIERYMDGERDFEVEPHIEGPWESIQHVLTEITDVRNTEKVIVHNELFYKGQIDCIASYRNEVSLIEWKVSSKPKIMLSQTYDNPLQVAAYVGALNRCGILKRMKVPSITTGVLVITYEDGEPANIHVMNERICNKYWLRWKERLYHYWALQYQLLMTSL